MSPDEIEAIVGGYHADPFRILGPHAVRKRGGQTGWEVRAFLPQALSASLLIGEQIWPMEKSHDVGFYCAALTGVPEKYRIQATLWDGPTIEFRRPVPLSAADHRFRAAPARRGHALRDLPHARRAPGGR